MNTGESYEKLDIMTFPSDNLSCQSFEKVPFKLKLQCKLVIFSMWFIVAVFLAFAIFFLFNRSGCFPRLMEKNILNKIY